MWTLRYTTCSMHEVFSHQSRLVNQWTIDDDTSYFLGKEALMLNEKFQSEEDVQYYRSADTVKILVSKCRNACYRICKWHNTKND